MSDNSAMSYDIHIPGIGPLIHILADILAKVMINGGRFLMVFGQFIEYHNNKNN
jgi:hypothetical protein